MSAFHPLQPEAKHLHTSERQSVPDLDDQVTVEQYKTRSAVSSERDLDMQPAVRNALINSRPMFDSMLAELREAHQQLLAEMANIDALTRAPQPGTEEFATARWRISQANLLRRKLSTTIRDALLLDISEQGKATLKLLQEADQEMMLKSRAHVSSWTTEKIRMNWPGYCEASRLIRWHMDAHIALEQRFLYPILERLSGQ